MEIIWDKRAINTLITAGFIKRKIHSFKRKKYKCNFEKFIEIVEKVFKNNKIREIRIFKLSDLPEWVKKTSVKPSLNWIKKKQKAYEKYGANVEDYLIIDKNEKILIIMGDGWTDLEIFFLK